MPRPLGSWPDSSRPATAQSLTEACEARFRAWMNVKWSPTFADAILDDDALSVGGILRRVHRSSERKALQALVELRSRALAARRRLDEIDSAALIKMESPLRDLLRKVVDTLPRDLIADQAPWERELGERRRVWHRAAVTLRASGVVVRKPFTDRELAVIGILAGVKPTIERGDTIQVVLRREARCYASMRRRRAQR